MLTLILIVQRMKQLISFNNRVNNFTLVFMTYFNVFVNKDMPIIFCQQQNIIQHIMKHKLQNRGISLPVAIVPVHHMCSVTNKHELVTWISYASCISHVLYVFTTTGMQDKILCNNVCAHHIQ